MDIFETNTVIIGAGVIGLACAYELSKTREIIVLEKESEIGQGISSRNSEVIHAGIYYPENSLKAKLCVKGKYLLYEFLQKNNVNYIKRGKYIVSTESETDYKLYELKENAKKCGVDDIIFVSNNKLIKKGIKCSSALYSPSTGVFLVHEFMELLAQKIKSNKGDIVLKTEVIDIKYENGKYNIYVKDNDNNTIILRSEIIVNCAGLYAHKIASMLNYHYKVFYCKGEYFVMFDNKTSQFKELVYPLPEKEGTGLGIHLTIDTGGRCKLGPDSEYIDKIDYTVNKDKKQKFFLSVNKFLPWIKIENLYPDMAGIRPKLQGPDDAFKDFIIENKNGFINLIGIESPGLTASLAIGKYVKSIL